MAKTQQEQERLPRSLAVALRNLDQRYLECLVNYNHAWKRVSSFTWGRGFIAVVRECVHCSHVKTVYIGSRDKAVDVIYEPRPSGFSLRNQKGERHTRADVFQEYARRERIMAKQTKAAAEEAVESGKVVQLHDRTTTA